MRARLSLWVLALAGAAVVMWRGAGTTEDIYWSDFDSEARPAFEALVRGDLHGFLAGCPFGYAGSMLLRAPFAAFGHDVPSIYRLGALVCVLALAAVAAHLAGRLRDRFPGDRWWLLVLVLGAASPMAWLAVWMGHPEEPLTAALAVAAVLVARSDRPLLAGALLGLAVASKQWAVLAALPTVLAAPRRPFRLLVAAGVTGAVLVLPVLLSAPGAGVAPHLASSSAQWFYPRQLWWPLGVEVPLGVDQAAGAQATPAWLAPIAKPLIVLLAVPLSAAWWLRAGGRRRDRTDALGLLALLMLVRCMLDPWNVVYYELPLVVALLAWEVERGHRVPVLALLTTAAVWLSFQSYDAASGYGPYLAFLAWTLPLLAVLVHELYGRPQRSPAERLSPVRAGAHGPVPAPVAAA
jgi:hypothetical protein